MGDGADWIWNICEEQFPGAIQIVDLYHARQHLWDLGGKLHPNDEKAKRRWVMAHQHFLDDGKIEKLVAKLRSLSPDNPELAAAVRIEASYFERNAERMRYPKFRKQNLFVGSGVIEAGCPFEADRVIAEAVARGALAARAPGCAGAQMAVRPRALFQTVPAVETVFLNTL